jgi:hypothetical protein
LSNLLVEDFSVLTDDSIKWMLRNLLESIKADSERCSLLLAELRRRGLL